MTRTPREYRRRAMAHTPPLLFPNERGARKQAFGCLRLSFFAIATSFATIIYHTLEPRNLSCARRAAEAITTERC